AGYPIILAGIVFILMLQFAGARTNWVNTIAAIWLIFVGQLVFWATAYPLAVKIAHWMPLTQAAIIHLSIFYLLWVLAVVRVISWIHTPEIRESLATVDLRKPVLIVLGVLAVCAILFAGPFAPASGGPGKRVLILNSDKLDNRIPNYDRYGDRSGGMFGMLPRYCRGLGYDVRQANVTPEIFDSIDVCIF
ncbi:MAG: hypothetical protein GY869_28415, partial [Planctomycetes bacterium]|nr:hypothetical protein [Planctomycetota bacterium]